MLTAEQMQKVWNLSDTVLYPEAVAFIQRFVQEGNDPLPPSQVAGLLNLADNTDYADLAKFIKHQSERDWPPRQKNIKVFYTELEKLFTTMRTQRLRREFHLVDEHAAPQAFIQQVDLFMIAIVREFIQHLAAENNWLAQQHDEQRRNNGQQRSNGYRATNGNSQSLNRNHTSTNRG